MFPSCEFRCQSAFLRLLFSRFLSEISELTSVKKEDVISTLQYLNLINYYKVSASTSSATRSEVTSDRGFDPHLAHTDRHPVHRKSQFSRSFSQRHDKPMNIYVNIKCLFLLLSC